MSENIESVNSDPPSSVIADLREKLFDLFDANFADVDIKNFGPALHDVLTYFAYFYGGLSLGEYLERSVEIWHDLQKYTTQKNEETNIEVCNPVS